MKSLPGGATAETAVAEGGPGGRGGPGGLAARTTGGPGGRGGPGGVAIPGGLGGVASTGGPGGPGGPGTGELPGGPGGLGGAENEIGVLNMRDLVEREKTLKTYAVEENLNKNKIKIK
jgi:hypothetical protein